MEIPGQISAEIKSVRSGTAALAITVGRHLGRRRVGGARRGVMAFHVRTPVVAPLQAPDCPITSKPEASSLRLSSHQSITARTLSPIAAAQRLFAPVVRTQSASAANSPCLTVFLLPSVAPPPPPCTRQTLDPNRRARYCSRPASIWRGISRPMHRVVPLF